MANTASYIVIKSVNGEFKGSSLATRKTAEMTADKSRDLICPQGSGVDVTVQ